MHITRPAITLILLSLLALPACRSQQEGSIEGTMVPRGQSAVITVSRDKNDILTVPVDGRDGTFKLALVAGMYSIKVAVPGSPHPLQLNDISVQSGASTILPPIDLTPAVGTGGLSGKIIPARPNADVTLISKGRERAAVHADQNGYFEFKEVPSGSYVVQAHAPGHAADSIPVVITDARMVGVNAVLLPITSIEGVDWTSGKIHAAGVGMPPRTAANETIRREMAKRAALTDARRNMLRIIEQLRIDDNLDMKTAMRSKKVASKIQGCLKGSTIISERELDDGRFEVVLELPITGPAGLSRCLAD